MFKANQSLLGKNNTSTISGITQRDPWHRTKRKFTKIHSLSPQAVDILTQGDNSHLSINNTQTSFFKYIKSPPSYKFI